MRGVDEGGTVRKGEALDIGSVHAWLSGHISGLGELPKVTQYPKGASNWTYRLQYRERDLVLRRPPAGTKAKSAHDMVREYTVQQSLFPVYPYVPRMVALCRESSVIGCDFYVMERIAGLIPRANLPEGVTLDALRTRLLCTNMLDRLVELHGIDPVSVGLDKLGKGPGYCRRQVDGWSERYLRAKTWNVPSFERVRDWLATNVPEDASASVIHNDWRFDNLVLDVDDPTRIVGVLDWEMATVGDPLMDLGSMLAYWVRPDDNFVVRSMRRQPTHLPGMFSRQEVVEHYLQRTGLRPSSWAFYEVFGVFRLAVIAQQIYYRYHHSQTRNPAFRNFWVLVHVLERRCRKLIP